MFRTLLEVGEVVRTASKEARDNFLTKIMAKTVKDENPLEHYEKVSIIGQGGFATVYLVQAKSL